MAIRKRLTDRFVRSLDAKARKAPRPGQETEYLDNNPQGFGLRVTRNWHLNYQLVAHYPGSKGTRRTLGDVYIPSNKAAPRPRDQAQGIRYGALTLGEAREKARAWLDLIARGIDPRVEEERGKAAQIRKQANSLAAAVKDFLDRPATKELAKYNDCEKSLNDFVKRCGARPITEITAQDVTVEIRDILARGAKYQAFNSFGYIRRFFNWAIGTQEYGLNASPMQHLDAGDLIGERELRNRVLTDAELRAAWQAAGELGYPYGPLVRLLILTGQRVREIADMSWSEIDFDRKLITIPAYRMKGGRTHEVPLADDALAIFRELDKARKNPPIQDNDNREDKITIPLWDKGQFVFSSTRGEKPVNGFSKAKERLDKKIAAIVAEKAKDAGVEAKPMPAYVLHDLRRTARTHFSALPVQDLIRELVIAHAKPGLHQVYDQHRYEAEKRECLELWEKRLARITAPSKPANVIDMDQARSERAGAA